MIAMTLEFHPEVTAQDRVLQHDRQLVCCRYNADSSLLFAAGFDGLLHRWRLEDDQHESFAAPGGWIESMLLHPDGQRLFTADSWGQVCCWPTEGETLTPLWQIGSGNSAWLRDLAVSSNGEKIATCGNDRMVRVFSAADGKLERELGGHDYFVQSVCFYNDGQSLASGDQRGIVKHWDLATGKHVRDLDAGILYKRFEQYDQGGARTMTFDSDFQTLYCGGFQGSNANQAQGLPTVVALDWESGERKLAMTPTEEFTGPVLDVAFHPAGYLIATGSSEAGGRLWFWKPDSEKDCHRVTNPTSFRGLDVNKDGTRLAATAFGDHGGQRGGNGRRLNDKGEYLGFAGNIVLYTLNEMPKE